MRFLHLLSLSLCVAASDYTAAGSAGAVKSVTEVGTGRLNDVVKKRLLSSSRTRRHTTKSNPSATHIAIVAAVSAPLHTILYVVLNTKSKAEYPSGYAGGVCHILNFIVFHITFFTLGAVGIIHNVSTGVNKSIQNLVRVYAVVAVAYYVSGIVFYFRVFSSDPPQALNYFGDFDQEQFNAIWEGDDNTSWGMFRTFRRVFGFIYSAFALITSIILSIVGNHGGIEVRST